MKQNLKLPVAFIAGSEYQKDIVPVPRAMGEKTEVWFSLQLFRLFELDESANNFKAKFRMNTMWFDKR